VISLKDTDTSELAAEEMGNLGGNIQKKASNLHPENSKSTVLVWGVLGALAVAAIVLLVIMLIKSLPTG
jgi:hypothetical protein